MTTSQLQNKFINTKSIIGYVPEKGIVFNTCEQIIEYLLAKLDRDKNVNLTDRNCAITPLRIEIRYPRLMSICPYSAFADCSALEIFYVPGKYLMEMSSFAALMKLFTPIALSHENVLSIIHKILVDKLDPLELTTIMDASPFNSMDFKLTSHYENKKGNK